MIWMKGGTIFLILAVVVLFLVLCYIHYVQTSALQTPRFRKREKVLFYGRKTWRKVYGYADDSILSSSGGTTGRERKRQNLIVCIVTKLLRFKKEQEPQWKARPPATALLDNDWPELECDERLYMLKNMRVLGHFDKPIFLELCQFIESRFIPAGAHLFRIGDPDDSIYVIQSGTVSVYITEPVGKTIVVKEVNRGESILSLLSIMDVMTGHRAPYKTVSAAAVTDSTILRLPAHAFQIVLERNPQSMARVIKTIMVQLQRVTFASLHDYLGLSHELINRENPADKNFLIHTIASHVKTSPVPSTVPVQCQVAAAGAENVAVTTSAVPVTRVEGDASDVTKPVKKRWRLFKRKNSDEKEKTNAIAKQPAVKCKGARVGGSLLADDPVVSLPTPVHISDEKSSSRGTSVRQSLKSALTESRCIPIQASCTTGEKEQKPEKDQFDNGQILDMATQDIASLLGLKDVKELYGMCRLLHCSIGTTLVKEGDKDSHIYFVVTGELEVQQQVVGNESEQQTMYRVCPGELVGTWAVLAGEPSFFTIRVIADTRLIFIAKDKFYGMMKEQPKVILNVGHTVVQRMSGFVRQIDFALDWMLIEAGRALYRHGEQSNCCYIVLNGRLRSVVQLPSGKKDLVEEYGRGDFVGLVEVLTQTARSSTLMAVRDTELAQIPVGLLDHIKHIYPQVVTRLIHQLCKRILGSHGNRGNASAVLSDHPTVELRTSLANLRTVAIFPMSDSVPLANFTLELQHALSGIRPTVQLSREIVQDKLRIDTFDSINEYHLLSWLGKQEDIHQIVLYQCDLQMTSWTERCLRQADCVLILALACQDPAVGQLEKQLDVMDIRAQKELILLHRQDGPRPRNTVEWLNLREWCSSHHHVRCHNRMFSRKPQPIMMGIYEKLLDTEPDRMSDLSRLARFLTGTTVGVVLGGGGARGCAHVGMIRALWEARIPIDFVAGSSIGAFLGALWAEDTDVTRFVQRARDWCMRAGGRWKRFLDLTYPIASFYSGRFFNNSVKGVFRDLQIEDLWIPFFCVSTDLTSSTMRIHTHGSVWRYTRSSMTLPGYLPPLCDPRDGHLLVDGGFLNNLPADVMKAMGVQTVFAIDVGVEEETDLTNFGEQLSGWWLLSNKWNPWAKPIKVLTMVDILLKVTFVSSLRQLEHVKCSGLYEYIRPPIDQYRTLQFGSFDDICQAGHNHGKKLMGEWKKSGRIKNMFTERHPERAPTVDKPSMANFTDLADLIYRISNPTDVTASHNKGTNLNKDAVDSLSIHSELLLPKSCKVKSLSRSWSEGASPGSTSVSTTDEDDDDNDEK